MQDVTTGTAAKGHFNKDHRLKGRFMSDSTLKVCSAPCVQAARQAVPHT